MEHIPPQEGYDYLTDLYAVIGASADTEQAIIDARLAEKEAVVADTPREGRLVQLLGQARRILTDPSLRSVYNTVLGEWEGPVSRDGSPVMSVTELLRKQHAELSPHDVEIAVLEVQRRAAQKIGYRPERLAFIRQLVDPETTDTLLLAEYDTALLDKDRVLRVAEHRRSQLIGITDSDVPQQNIRPGHRMQVIESIARAKEQAVGQHWARMAGSFISRLTMLYGDAGPILAEQDPLPAYFESQARELARTAQQREGILRQRVAGYRPTYLNKAPEHHRQHVILVNPEQQKLASYTYHSDERKWHSILDAYVPPTIQSDAYEPLAAAGYDILRIDERQDIANDLLVAEALKKHRRYLAAQSHTNHASQR